MLVVLLPLVRGRCSGVRGEYSTDRRAACRSSSDGRRTTFGSVCLLGRPQSGSLWVRVAGIIVRDDRVGCDRRSYFVGWKWKRNPARIALYPLWEIHQASSITQTTRRTLTIQQRSPSAQKERISARPSVCWLVSYRDTSAMVQTANSTSVS